MAALNDAAKDSGTPSLTTDSSPSEAAFDSRGFNCGSTDEAVSGAISWTGSEATVAICSDCVDESGSGVASATTSRAGPAAAAAAFPGIGGISGNAVISSSKLLDDQRARMSRACRTLSAEAGREETGLPHCPQRSSAYEPAFAGVVSAWQWGHHILRFHSRRS